MLRLKAKVETGSSYVSFKLWNQSRLTRGQPGVNLHLPTMSILHISRSVQLLMHSSSCPWGLMDIARYVIKRILNCLLYS